MFDDTGGYQLPYGGPFSHTAPWKDFQRSMPGSKRSKTFSTVSPSRPALDHQLMTYIQPGFRLGATILCCGEGIAQVETLNEFHDDKLSIPFR